MGKKRLQVLYGEHREQVDKLWVPENLLPENIKLSPHSALELT